MAQAGQVMAAQVDPDVVKRVTYSKYLMDRAYDHWQRGGDLDAAQAILLAHDSAEMLMRAIGDFEHVRLPDGFMVFWDEIRKKTGIEPPHKGQMDRLNNVRGAFKHKGILPNATVVADLLPLTRSFCEEATELFLGIKYHEISLADLIPNDRVRQLLKDAETAIAAKDMRKAFEALGIAFDVVVREAVTKNNVGLVEDFNFSYFTEQELGSEIRREISNGLKELGDTVNMLVLGIDPIKRKRFSLITPLRQHTVSGNVLIVWTRDPEKIDPSAYDFGYRFVLESGLRLLSL